MFILVFAALLFACGTIPYKIHVKLFIAPEKQ